MRYLPLVIICILSHSVWGQDFYSYYKSKFDLEKYNHSLERFRNSDSTLTMEDFKDLYFSAVSLPSYNPEKINAAEERIREANFKKDFQKAIQLSDSLLASYPMSIQAYFEKSWACHNLNRFDEELYNNKRYKVLIRAILSSGDGKSIASSYHANLPNDEFEVIKYLGFDIKEEKELSFNERVIDLFSLKPNKAKIKEIYFDVSQQRRL